MLKTRVCTSEMSLKYATEESSADLNIFYAVHAALALPDNAEAEQDLCVNEIKQNITSCFGNMPLLKAFLEDLTRAFTNFYAFLCTFVHNELVFNIFESFIFKNITEFLELLVHRRVVEYAVVLNDDGTPIQS